MLFKNLSKFPWPLTYHAKSNQSSDQEAVDFILSHKKGVVQFVLEWYNVAGDAFLENPAITKFLKVMHLNIYLINLQYTACMVSV